MVLSKISTPAYICDESKLEDNLKLLKKVSDESGLNIIMALKGFALWGIFDLVRKYISGISASGLHEAMLGFETVRNINNTELHTYSAGFNPNEIEKIAKISSHIVFNSLSQLKKYFDYVKNINPEISIGLRVNPQHSTTSTELYDACSPNSRFGVKSEDFKSALEKNSEYSEYLKQINGIHFHALCEQNSDDLTGLFQAFEEKFSPFFGELKELKWINMGGGHLITRKDYDVEKLINFVKSLYLKYNFLKFYIEPSEAIGWQTGVLVAEVLDIVENGMKIAILDASAETHMPDVLAMPYTPQVIGGSKPFEREFTYRLAGNSCLAGDIIGDYSFDEELKIGDKIIFEDMIHYTMVKNNTFNGLPLPTIAVIKKNGNLKILKRFGYTDYKNRLS
jgi:carboxynorspermidine decarboxylase